MLIILHSALFVAGWIFVNNSHKFSFNTMEFWKKWPPLLLNLACKGGCYFKVAVTTFCALQLLYFALKIWGCQESNISNIHWNKTKKKQQQHWAHINVKLTCNIPDIFVACQLLTIFESGVVLRMTGSVKDINIGIVLFCNTWSLIPPGNGVTVSPTYWYREFIKPWTAKAKIFIILYYL